jgi:hypothetical protein
MNISVSGRKPFNIPIKKHVDFLRSYAKEGGLTFSYKDIDFVWGSVEGSVSAMYGGRISPEAELSHEDVGWLYDNDIGVKIPLSTVYFDEEQYTQTKKLLSEYHRQGNAIIVSTEVLAKRIREDFPLYKIELSAVKDIYNQKKLDAIDRSLFDTIVFPMCANNDLEFLKSVEDKDQIRLFSNVECSYSCPNKVCYTSISKINKDGQHEDMKCSWYTYNLPRTFSRSDVDMSLFSNKNDSAAWDELIFNNKSYTDLGYTSFKLLNYDQKTQRISILNKE